MAGLDDLLEASNVLELGASETNVTDSAKRDPVAAVESALRPYGLRVDVVGFQLLLRRAVDALVRVELEHRALPEHQRSAYPPSSVRRLVACQGAQVETYCRSAQQAGSLKSDSRSDHALLAQPCVALKVGLPRSHEREVLVQHELLSQAPSVLLVDG
jgi:hypothetical protein